LALTLGFDSGIAIAPLSSKPMNIPKLEVNAMKKNLLAAAGFGALLILPQVGFSQTSTYSSSASRTTEANPHAVTNNTLATHGGTGFNNPSQWGRANAEYVQHEIARAKSEGKDVRMAENQYRVGLNALNNGLNKEAAEHFDSALRAVGVQPKVQGQNPGEPAAGHEAMPGNTQP